MHVAVLVKQAALVVKAVAHFVAYHHSDASVVCGVICLMVEERWLEDTCREADLVGRRVVVGIDGLRSHQPLGLVYRLSNLAVNHVCKIELGGVAHVLIVRQAVVYGEL